MSTSLPIRLDPLLYDIVTVFLHTICNNYDFINFSIIISLGVSPTEKLRNPQEEEAGPLSSHGLLSSSPLLGTVHVLCICQMNKCVHSRKRQEPEIHGNRFSVRDHHIWVTGTEGWKLFRELEIPLQRTTGPVLRSHEQS